MEHPVLVAIRRASFTPFGWFRPDSEDGVPPGTQFVILIGNAGPEMFQRFANERDPDNDKLDNWTHVAVSALARELAARAVFPFEKPYPPMLTWARKAGAGHVSPLGLNIHPVYGLWHAFRAALLFDVAFDLPGQEPGTHPCETCDGRPCLTTCPVSAFTANSYDTAACAGHLRTAAGASCMDGGCLARHACPVGQTYAYSKEQAHFHMRAFLQARQQAG
jgi:hypothetical protein